MKNTGCLIAALFALNACSSLAPVTDHLVLVSQAASSTIAVIDPQKGEVIKHLTVGGLPHRLLVVGDRVYAVLVGSQAIAEIDINSLELTRTFLTAPVPAKRNDSSLIQGHIDRDAFGKTSCFVCHNTEPGAAKPFVVGDRPVGMTLSSDGQRLIVSHIRGSRLSVLNRASGQLEQTLALAPAGDATELSDVARVGNKLAVSLRPTQPSSKAGALRWLNETTLEMISETPTGSDPSFILPLPERESALISNFETNTVSEFQPGLAPISYQVTPGPLGSRRLADGRVLTLNYYSNSVSLLDIKTPRVETYKLELNKQIFVNPTNAAISPDGRLAYIVSSGTDAHLLVFNLQEHRVIRAISIDGLSFDVTVISRIP